MTEPVDPKAETKKIEPRCRQEGWCPGLPVACQKHVDQMRYEVDRVKRLMGDHAIEWASEREEMGRKLTQASKLLEERARENAELLAEIERLKARKRIEPVE
ncbi:MAG: hypothetical protein ACRD1X_12425 [Vicinamibacteria bacterium]